MSPSAQTIRDDLQQLHLLICNSSVINSKSLKFMLDDEFLLQFYKGRKYNVDSAYDSLCNYINRRLKCSHIMQDIVPFKVALMDLGMCQLLTQPDHHGRTVIVFRPGKVDPEKYTVSDMLRDALLTIDDVLRSFSSACEEGVVALIDCSDVSFGHIRQVTPFFARDAMNLLVNSVPLKFKGIHIVHETLVLGGVIRLFKQFLPMKIRKRVHIHSDDLEKLHKYIQPHQLPHSLGGSLPEEDAYDKQRVCRISSREQQYTNFVGLI